MVSAIRTDVHYHAQLEPFGWVGRPHRLPILHCTPQLHRSSGRHTHTHTHTHTSLNTDLAGSMQILSNSKVIVLFNTNHVTVNKMYFRMLQVEADKVISSTDDGNENNKTTCYISHFKVLICIMYKCTLKLDLWRQYEWSFLMQISKPQCYSGCKRIVSMLWEVARSFLGWYGCNGIVKPSFHDFRHLYTILHFGP